RRRVHLPAKRRGNEPSVHSGNRPYRMNIDEAAREFESRQIAIDAVKNAVLFPAAETILEGGFKERYQSFFRSQDNAPRRLEPMRTNEFVAMQSSDALQKHLNGTKIGYQNVRIYIETLLERLRAYNYESRRRSFL